MQYFLHIRRGATVWSPEVTDTFAVDHTRSTLLCNSNKGKKRGILAFLQNDIEIICNMLYNVFVGEIR